MTTDILIDPHAQAILTLARTATMPNGALIRVGDGVAPKSADGTIGAPYAVLHIRPGGWVAGSLGRTNTDLLLRFQMTAVGNSPREARGVADRLALTLEGATVAVAGRSTVRIGRPPDASPIANASPDPQVKDLFYVPVEYRLWTVPA